MIYINPNSVILFQGDSITDSSRSRQELKDMGNGYAFLIAAELSFSYPRKNLTFLNRGIAGNTVKHLQERWKEDCLDLQPSLLTILIGVNDFYTLYAGESPISYEEFENAYRDILVKTRDNTKARIVICEPFVVPVAEEQKQWRKYLDVTIGIVRNLAIEFNALLIPLDGIFASACTYAPPKYWAEDGVHPTAAGQELIARSWMNCIKINEQES